MTLLAHSLLFNPASTLGWYAGCGDGTSVDIQTRMIDEMDKYGADTMSLNIMNEDLSSPFAGEYMNSPLDNRKYDLFEGFVAMLKARGKQVVIVFFDGDEHSAINATVKYPFHEFRERHAPFMEIVTRHFAPVASGFCIGIETNRYVSMEMVEQALVWVERFAIRTQADGTIYHIPVFTHEQNVGWKNDNPYLKRPVPRNAKIAGFEMSNHPYYGDDVTPEHMVREVTALYESCHKQIWVMESNSKKGGRAKDQNNALADLPFVVGVDGVM